MYMSFKRLRQRQAGKRYESFVAQTLRQEGWEVIESGLDGYNDHGIDLIANKDGVKRYIQCKGWNRNRFIHEDVVSHLYGSVAAIEGPENPNGVERYIYSPAQLDEYASDEAAKLNIHIVHLDGPKWHQRYRQYNPYPRH
jgi:hypothetical protein